MNKSTELKQATQLVRMFLIQDKQTRNSDSYLYLKVIEYQAEKKGVDLKNISIPVFLLNSADWGFFPFETIRRTRQKEQEKNPALAACDTVEDFRIENEAAFTEYARG